MVHHRFCLMCYHRYGLYPLPCQEGICSIAKVPFRGAPCSDAGGRQKPYSWIMKQVNSSLSGRLWDEKQQAPYFNYKVRHICLIF